MTLGSLITAIAEKAKQQKVINSSAAGTDIYTYFANTIKDYPTLFAAPTGQHIVAENTTTFSITLYYFDRLLNDSSNELDILSVAVEQLKNLVRWIMDIDGVVEVEQTYQITNFVETEALQDRCCGAYTTLRITVINETICPVL